MYIVFPSLIISYPMCTHQHTVLATNILSACPLLSLTHSLTLSLTLSPHHSLSHLTHSLTHSLSHSLTHSSILSPTLIHSLTHPFTLSFPSSDISAQSTNFLQEISNPTHNCRLLHFRCRYLCCHKSHRFSSSPV